MAAVAMAEPGSVEARGYSRKIEYKRALRFAIDSANLYLFQTLLSDAVNFADVFTEVYCKMLYIDIIMDKEEAYQYCEMLKILVTNELIQYPNNPFDINPLLTQFELSHEVYGKPFYLCALLKKRLFLDILLEHKKYTVEEIDEIKKPSNRSIDKDIKDHILQSLPPGLGFSGKHKKSNKKRNSKKSNKKHLH